MPKLASATTDEKRDKKAANVYDRMTKNPVTVTPGEALTEALKKMKRGRFRHLPVVDDDGKLVAVLSDRDIRLIRPSSAFVEKENALIQFSSIAVQQAAVFDPIKINTDTALNEAAKLMLRWQVGGLPVIDKQEKVVGILTYTDILRAFVEHQENS